MSLTPTDLPLKESSERMGKILTRKEFFAKMDELINEIRAIRKIYTLERVRLEGKHV